MKRLIFTLLALCLALSASAQVQSKWFVVGTITSAGNQGGGVYAVTVSINTDQSGNGYNGSDVMAGYRAVTAVGRNYSVTSVTTSGATSVTITVQNLEVVSLAPSGRIVLYEYSAANPYIPVGAINSPGISAAFSSVIVNHNFQIIPTGGGLSTISTDATLTGDGSAGDPVKVDTTLIATQNYVITTIDATGQMSVELYATGGESTLSIPFQINTSKPLIFTRNGVGQSIGDATRQVTLSGTTFTINGQALESGERIRAMVFPN